MVLRATGMRTAAKAVVPLAALGAGLASRFLRRLRISRAEKRAVEALADALADRCAATDSPEEVVKCCLDALREELDLEHAAVVERQPGGGLVVREVSGRAAVGEALGGTVEGARFAEALEGVGDHAFFLVGVGPAPAPVKPHERAFVRRLAPNIRAALLRIDREKRLRDQLLFTREITGSLDEGVCATDRSGRVLFLNTAAERLLGWTERELLGHDFHELTQCREGGRCLLQAVAENQTAHATEELEVRRRDGQVVTLSVRYAPLKNGDGGGVVAAFHDVTEVQRALRERRRFEAELARERARLEAIIDHLPAGVMIMEAATGRVRMNAECTTLIDGRPVEQWPAVRPDGSRYRPGDFPIERSLRTGEVVWREEMTVERRPGQWITLLVSSAPLRDDDERITAAVATTVDITARKRVESALRESERRYDYAARATNDVLYDWDIDSGEIAWNGALRTMFGYRPENGSHGIRWWEHCIHPADRQQMADSLEAAIAGTAESWSGEYRFVRDDGTYATVLDRGYVVRDASGHAHRMIGTMLDVTARRRAEQEQRFLARASAMLSGTLDHRAALERVAELCVRQVADGCSIELVREDGTRDPVAVAYTDPEREAEVVARFHAMRREAGRTVLDRVFEEGRSYIHPDVRQEHPQPDGPLIRWMHVRSYLCVPIGTREGVVGTLTLWRGDGPDLYAVEDLHLAEDLASRLGAAVELAILYRRAQEATQVRERFLRIASHELRTPMTVMQLSIQRCLLWARGLPPATERRDDFLESLGRVERQGRRLSRLVRDLLDVSRLSDSRVPIERTRVDLSATVSEVLEELAPQLDSAGYAVARDIEPGVVGRWDAVRISQVATNLVVNAMKYGRGRPIGVRVQSEGGEAVLTVEDQGIGIAPEDQARIFEPFERAVDPDAFGGAGLGLYVIRQIVETHGGSVSVESTLDVGSRFIVRLPLAPAASTRPEPTQTLH